MTDLLSKTLLAYGGTERWNRLTSVSAHKRFGGAIWDIKQVPGIVEGKSPGVVGFRRPGVMVPGLMPGVSLPVSGWAIA